MSKRAWIALGAAALAALLMPALAEVSLRLDPAEARAGDVVRVQVEAGEDAAEVTYTLLRDEETVFQGEKDTHFRSAFRPRQEGEYRLTVEVTYGDGSTDTGAAEIRVSGQAEESQGPEIIYSQKDGSWKDKLYGKSELDNAGCAIFTLSHVLQRMGWTGDRVAPENLAETYRNCYTKAGTANARLIYNAGQDFGYDTKNALIKEKAALREGLRNGDYYSFGIVIGHIALMAGIDDAAGKVLVVDSAPSATFERIKKGSIYYLRDGEYIEAKEPDEIPGSVYYFETRFYGGLSYYMDLDYCARRGGRQIRPNWVYVQGENGRIGAGMVSLGSGECEISVNKLTERVLTRDLAWGETGQPLLAQVSRKKAVRLNSGEGKRLGTIPTCTLIPVLREEEEAFYVIWKDQRGYVSKADAIPVAALEGKIYSGVIHVKGSTSGRAKVKMRFGPSEKERPMDNWKTGTQVTLIGKEGEFWQVEAGGVRLWIHQDYLQPEEGAEEALAGPEQFVPVEDEAAPAEGAGGEQTDAPEDAADKNPEQAEETAPDEMNEESQDENPENAENAPSEDGAEDGQEIDEGE